MNFGESMCAVICVVGLLASMLAGAAKFDRDNHKLAVCRDAGLHGERNTWGEIQCMAPVDKCPKVSP